MKTAFDKMTISGLMGLTLFLLVSSSSAGLGFKKNKVCKQVVGTVTEFMPRYGNNIGPGSLVADAMLGQTSFKGSQVALISSAEIRSDLQAGILTKNEIRRLLLNSPLMTFEFSGADLHALIEMMAVIKKTTVFENIGIHVAGVRFTFIENAEVGQKVKNLEIGSLETGYKPCGSSERFRIVSTIYALDEIIALKGRQYLRRDVAIEWITLHQALEAHCASLSDGIMKSPENRINITSAHIMVFSDPHYFDPSLLINNGSAFQAYIAQDRKMIAESRAILLSAVSTIRQANPDICLIPGDLTKDGELLSHSNVSQIITDSLLSAGIKVYVTPGNHDINNKEAFSYDGSVTLPVDGINEHGFVEVYDQCGYGEAIARDTSSLSYIAEPANGLWILSIDACNYGDNETHSPTGGTISGSTLAWILEKIDYARKHNITVFGMMHHGVTEHYTDQTQIIMGMFRDYVVDNWVSLRDTLAAHGLSVVFTGHYHAQDIVKHSDANGNFIIDIETGATVTWPCPIRSVTLSADRTLNVSSSVIETIDYPLPVLSFQEYAKTYLFQGLSGMVYHLLTMQFGVPAQQAQMLSPVVASAFVAHYAGDEQPGPVEIATYTQLKMSADPLTQSFGLALESLWTDLQPGDNACRIDLTNGDIR